MLNGCNGGKWALVGFLYQIVGMLSITARASSPVSISNREGSDEVDALLTLIGVGEGLQAHHERFEQDVVFTRDDECVLVQFKYSTTGRKIRRRDLRKIIKKLDEGARLAESHGQNVTACALVTNREFTKRGRAAKQLWDDEQNGERSYELRRFSGSMSNLVRKLREFGKEYGLFNREIEAGINELIGKVLYETGELFGASLNEGHVVESFTGCSEARRITIGSVVELSKEELNRFAQSMGFGPWKGDLVEREVFQDVIEATSRRALVGLYGPGGCGKSVLLWQLLSRLKDSGYCTVKPAVEVQQSWVTDTVHKWRKLPEGSRPPDTAEVAIERLIIASSGSQKPILWLGLDGLDERLELADQRARISDLIQWFWNRDCDCQNGDPPAATLVVSCRDKNDLRDKWLLLPPQPFFSGELPVTKEVGVFTESEVKSAARQSIPELYRRIRLRESILPPPLDQLYLLENDYDTLPVGLAPAHPESDSIDERVWKSLEHPAMWFALLSLPHPTQIGAVGGDRQSVYDLAHRFIKWFHWKLMLREQQRFRGLSEDDLLEVLRVIARTSRGTAANDREEHWIQPIPATHISPDEAKVLYNQAESAGLIIKLDARLRWQWRHAIVYDFLTSDT